MSIKDLIHNPFEDYEPQDDDLIASVAESFNQDTYADYEDNVLIANDKYALGIESEMGEEPTSKAYVDAQLAGDLAYDTEADQLLISDGAGWVTCAPPPEPIDISNADGNMVITANGLSVRTEDGDIDLLAKIQELEELVYKLTGMKRDEPTQTSADDPDAFNRAMKGI